MGTSSPVQGAVAGPGTAHVSRWFVLWQILTHFDQGKMLPWLALRNTAGVILPLIVGFTMGMPRGGLAMAVGALNVSYSDGSDPYARRAARMLRSTVWCAAAVFLGAVTGKHNVEAVLVATAWAFIAGLLVSVGATAADVGVISLVTLVVYAAQPLTPRQALESSLLALAGGLLQAGLSIALWPVRRYEPERRALANLFAELAELANKPAVAAKAPPVSASVSAASDAITAPGADGSTASLRFRALLSQAERIRLSQMALARLRIRVEREKPQDPALETIIKYLENTARVLHAVSKSLASGKPVGLDSDRVTLGVALAYQLDDQHRPESRPTFFDAMVRDARFQMDALSGQLRASIDLAGNASPEGTANFDRKESEKPLRLRFSGIQATLRANLNLNSMAFRHAVRLAVVLCLGDALGRAFDWRRSYWIPMTIVLVLKPEFATTFSRGILRIFGTVAGLLLATALFHFLPIHTAMEVLLIGAFAFLVRWVGPANYGVFAVAISALIVLLLTINGVSPKEVILARGTNTAAGGVLALLAYFAWPSWERSRVADLIAELLAAYRKYFSKVVGSFASGQRIESQELDLARQNSRTARSNLEASLERIAAEPGATRDELRHLGAILASSHRFAHAIMALEAGLAVTPAVPTRKEFLTFAEDVEKTLLLLERFVAGSNPVHEREFPDLRADHNRLIQAGDPSTARYVLSNIEADRMTNSLNTLRGQVAEWVRGQRIGGYGTASLSVEASG